MHWVPGVTTITAVAGGAVLSVDQVGQAVVSVDQVGQAVVSVEEAVPAHLAGAASATSVEEAVPALATSANLTISNIPQSGKILILNE
jgi:hypothetical protein